MLGNNLHGSETTIESKPMTEVAFRVVKEFDVVKVKLTKEAASRIAKLLAENKCVACECEHRDGDKVVCGCCSSCYQAQANAMRTGKKTLRELIRDGERLIPKSGGRKPGSKYAARILGREGEVV